MTKLVQAERNAKFYFGHSMARPNFSLLANILIIHKSRHNLHHNNHHEAQGMRYWAPERGAAETAD